MITIVIQKTGVRVEIKADIFASLEQLDTVGFDTRFTAMTIESDDASIIAGAAISETEYSWVAIKTLADDISATLTVYDLNAVAGGADKIEITL
jgi:hypothetical protein